MIITVSILAFLSMVGGFLGFCFDCIPVLESFLDDIGLLADEKELSTHFALSFGMLLAVVGGILGVIAAVYIYIKTGDRFMQALPLLGKSFYVDEIYDLLFVRPLKALSRFVGYVTEPYLIEGSLQGAVSIAQGTARKLQLIQSGQIRSYAAWMVAGAVFVIVYLVF
jgi:NADH-quinone oxidoreductase subunit L